VNQWFNRRASGWTNATDLKEKLDSPDAINDPYFLCIIQHPGRAGLAFCPDAFRRYACV